MACRNCSRDHAPVSLAEWSWTVRDITPKPPGGYLGVLWMLASRMDPKTGCGYASRDLLAADAGVGIDTVDRALDWGRRNLLVHRAARGHRIKNGVSAASEWQLERLTQLRTVAEPTQLRKRPDPTPQNGRLNSAGEVAQERPSQERPNQASAREAPQRLAPAPVPDPDD